MEPDAYDVAEHNIDYESKVALRSIAISLKRIADIIEGDKQQCGLLYYISCIEMNGRKN
jgi:hypothetical protein